MLTAFSNALGGLWVTAMRFLCTCVCWIALDGFPHLYISIGRLTVTSVQTEGEYIGILSLGEHRLAASKSALGHLTTLKPRSFSLAVEQRIVTTEWSCCPISPLYCCGQD